MDTVAWLKEVLLGVKKVIRSILVSGTFFSEDLAMKEIYLAFLPLLLIQEEQLFVNGDSYALAFVTFNVG